MRVAVLGAGFIGRVHLKAYSKFPGIELAGVFDVLPQAAQELAKEFETRAYPNARELCQAADAVSICSPSPSHLSLVEVAAELGKAVLCEKPLARSLADAQKILQLVQNHKIKLMVGQVLRYFPAYERARALIKQGALGQLSRVRCVRRVPAPKAPWYYRPEESGGCLLDTGIHDLDFLQWCFGPPKSLRFEQHLAGGPGAGPSRASGSLLFDEALSAELEIVWMADGSWFTSLEAQGSLGRLSADSTKPLELRLSVGNENRVFELGSEDPYEREIQAFVSYAQGQGQDSPLPAEEAFESLRLGLRCLESAGF